MAQIAARVALGILIIRLAVLTSARGALGILIVTVAVLTSVGGGSRDADHNVSGAVSRLAGGAVLIITLAVSTSAGCAQHRAAAEVVVIDV